MIFYHGVRDNGSECYSVGNQITSPQGITYNGFYIKNVTNEWQSMPMIKINTGDSGNDIEFKREEDDVLMIEIKTYKQNRRITSAYFAVI